MSFRLGLVVGKFAPLHKGHELLIRRALDSCDEVLVLSWAQPEPPSCAADRRARWLEEVFPEVRSCVVTDELLARQARGGLVGWRVPRDEDEPSLQRKFTGLLCRDLLGVTPDAVFTSEDYGDGLARELETVFAEAGGVSRAQVRHVSVDPDRGMVPISGTAIRDDVHRHREWLSPAVYASFLERVAILGGESSGKSTLAAALAERFGTTHTTEYGRDLWEERGGHLELDDMVAIGRRQIELEREAARRARRYLFCDTSPLTTLFYSQELFGRAEPELEAMAERSYSHTVLCAPDFPFVQDGTRREAAFRAKQHAWYEKELRRRGLRPLVVRGSVEARVGAVQGVLRSTPSSARTTTP